MSMLLGHIGTYEWCKRTRGLLSPGERRRFTAAIVLETARQLPRLLLARAGMWRSGPDPCQYALPSSPFAKRVLAVAAQLEPMLLEHSLRSYRFARALADVEGVTLDDEALFAGAMFHDLAFPTPDDSAEDRCFALRGAERAEALLVDSPLSAALRRDVLDAITLHLNPYVTRSQGDLPRLLHDGIMLDVVGVRAWELDKAGFERASDIHPRHAWQHRGFIGFCAHARRLPASRAALAVRCGLGLGIRVSPSFPMEVRTLRIAAESNTRSGER